jgi:hypothetical protein
MRKAIFSVLVLVCLMAIVSVGASAFDNTNWSNVYNISLTETTGYDLINYPIKINISGVVCGREDCKDIRIVSNDVEIPSYVTNDKSEVIFTANISGNFSGVWGYLYSNNSDAEIPVYDTGMTSTSINLDGSSSVNWLNVTIGGNNGLRYNIGRGELRSLFCDGCYNISVTSLEGEAGWFGWRDGGVFHLGGDSDTRCSLLENSSVYIKMNCSQGTYYHLTYEIFNNFPFYRYDPQISGGGVETEGLFMNSGASNYDQKYIKYGSLPDTITTITGEPVVITTDLGIIGFYSGSVPYINTFFYNVPIANTNITTSIYIRSNGEDPYGCLGSSINPSCDEGNWNLSAIALGTPYFGVSPNSDEAMLESYRTLMGAPLIQLTDVTPPPCVPNWNCSLFANCSANISECLAVEDLNVCGTQFGGNLSDFNEPCIECVPNWICSGWDVCQTDDIQPCNEATDTNMCGEQYGGNFSEFEPDVCDFCAPAWNCSEFGDCEGVVLSCNEVNDTHNCFAQTQLPSDSFTGLLGDYNGVCQITPTGYVPNYITGDLTGLTLDTMGSGLLVVLSMIGLVVLVNVVIYLFNRVKGGVSK